MKLLVGSLKMAVTGVFTPQKLINATNQGFFPSGKLAVKTCTSTPLERVKSTPQGVRQPDLNHGSTTC